MGVCVCVCGSKGKSVRKCGSIVNYSTHTGSLSSHAMRYYRVVLAAEGFIQTPTAGPSRRRRRL
jgi:hypothetical protein